MKNLKTFFVVCAAMSAAVAFAGPDERAKRKEFEAEIPSTQKAFKAACGCEIKFDIKWETFKKFSVMNSIHSLFESFKEYAPEVCKEPEAKANICKMKTVEFSYAEIPAGQRSVPEPQFAGGVMKATSDGVELWGLDGLAKLLDK